MFVITNMTKKPLKIDGVDISPKQQLNIINLTDEMKAAQKAGTLRVTSDETTLAERKADTKAINEGIAAMDKLIK